MKFNSYSPILIILIMSYARADLSMQGDGVFVKILGHSGKISIGWQRDVDNDNRAVVITMDELKEVDVDGNEVGTTGAVKHSFNTFANQDFSFTPLMNGTLGNLKVNYVNFTSQLNGLSSTIVVTVYIMQENGSLTIGNETMPVWKDSVKFSIQLSSWQWCDTVNQCSKGQQSQTGAYVDFALAVKSKANPLRQNKTKTFGDADPYSLGFGNMLLSHNVQLDGIWTTMPANYPLTESQGSKQRFIFRFAKFNSTAFYDPTVVASASSSDGPACCSHGEHVISYVPIIFSLAFLATIVEAFLFK